MGSMSSISSERSGTYSLSDIYQTVNRLDRATTLAAMLVVRVAHIRPAGAAGNRNQYRNQYPHSMSALSVQEQQQFTPYTTACRCHWCMSSEATPREPQVSA
jgi:hypothetical protein